MGDEDKKNAATAEKKKQIENAGQHEKDMPTKIRSKLGTLSQPSAKEHTGNLEKSTNLVWKQKNEKRSLVLPPESSG